MNFMDIFEINFKNNFHCGVMILYIDVDSKDGVYDAMSKVWYEIGQQLLEIFQMMGIRNERIMYPLYDFKFNKRPLYNIETV